MNHKFSVCPQIFEYVYEVDISIYLSLCFDNSKIFWQYNRLLYYSAFFNLYFEFPISQCSRPCGLVSGSSLLQSCHRGMFPMVLCNKTVCKLASALSQYQGQKLHQSYPCLFMSEPHGYCISTVYRNFNGGSTTIVSHSIQFKSQFRVNSE